MTKPNKGTRINPFEDDVVREPREVSFSVKGLNDAPLNHLLVEFASLDDGELPRARPVKAKKAQLVVSPDRGYGKSHLLGRLFAALGRRATKVYLRPFQDPYKAWHSILLLTVQELNRAENESAGDPSQLKALALGTLAHIVADFAQDGVPDDPNVKRAVPFLRQLAGGTLAATDTVHWMGWLGGLCADAGPINQMSNLLNSRHIDLHGHERAWLRVLAACAFHASSDERRIAAVKWLRAEPLEQEEVEQLGLRQADSDGRGDASAQEINALSFRRLNGLCQLASYYRPFVFCFDQTEFYASDPLLIKTLGNCFDQFYVDLPNHLTVVTANHANWIMDILPHIAAPQQDRLSGEIRLEGINIRGARELIAERLNECAVSPNDISRFFADDWLGTVFSLLPELGVRTLLTRASEHFQTLANPTTQLPSRPSLDDLFLSELNGIRATKALQAYNQDCLMWFAKDVGHAIKEVSVRRTSGRRYFSLEWNLPDCCVYFAFEGGDHWRRWKAIADEAIVMAQARGDRRFLAYVFRTPDLGKVPRPSWAAAKATLDKASGLGFRIVGLTSDEVCDLHAARELYSNALQGNIGYSGPETLEWLQKRFAAFLADIASAGRPIETRRIDAGGPAAVVPVIDKQTAAGPTELDSRSLQLLLDVVREQRIVDISVALHRLGSETLRDPLLRSVEAHPNLRAHPGPKTIFLQWRMTV
jgi:hypothetical protein